MKFPLASLRALPLGVELAAERVAVVVPRPRWSVAARNRQPAELDEALRFGRTVGRSGLASI